MDTNIRIDEHLIVVEPYYLPLGDELELAEAAYGAGLPMLLKGPTGCGKTRFMQYLAWKLKSLNYNARFIQLAAEINFDMPQYVLSKIADALNEAGKPLKDSRILLLGVAYKENVGDLRESPALDLIHLLQQKGARVVYHDPYVPHVELDEVVITRVTLDKATVRQADCVVITTAHKDYDWDWVAEHSQLIIDTRNATRNVAANSNRIVKL